MAIKKGIPPTNLYIKKYKNSFFLNFSVKLLNFFSNFSLINSFKKKFTNKYIHVAPIVKEIETTGGSAVAVELDVTDQASIDSMFERTSEATGLIDIVVNCAGIVEIGEFTELDDSAWDKVFSVNLDGLRKVSQEVTRQLIVAKRPGVIINVASVAGKDGNANASAYSSAKAGVIGLTKSLGKELAKYNIAVNAITPAGAKTKILDQMSKEHVQWMLSKVPRGRFLEINELSSMVCWLSSEENSFSTAAVFDISGGRSTY